MLRIRIQHAGASVPAGQDVLVLWDGLGPPAGYTGAWVSLPAEVRRNREHLRARCIDWLRDTGEGPVQGEPLAARLLIRPDLSYWWLTVPAEFTFEEDSLAYAAVRLMALADWSRDQPEAALECAIDDAALLDCLRDWCERRGWQYAQARPTGTKRRVGTGFGAIRAARCWLRAWRDSRSGRPSTAPRNAAPGLVVDYLAHVQVDGAGARSRYWANLPDVIRGGGSRLDWIHIFVPAPLTPTAQQATALATQLVLEGESHRVAQADVDWPCLLGAWMDYLRLRLLRLRFLRSCPRLLLDDIDPWPLLRARTANAFTGAAAMESCLWIRYFDRTLAREKKYQFGLFLQENQPWEMALVTAWRRHGHGTLVGVEHTTVRFWDLRLLKSPPVRELMHAAMPRPHITVLNGAAADAALFGMHDLADRTESGEALRFVGEFGEPTQARRAGLEAGRFHLLAVGEYDHGYASDQRRMLREIDALAKRADVRVSITWRPHPAAVGAASDLPAGTVVDQASALPDLLAACDLALVGDFSSSVLLARSLAVPVAVLLPARTLSSDVLGGQSVAGTVTSADELLDLLVAAAGRDPDRPAGDGIDGIFHLDPALPRWRSILSQIGVSHSTGEEAQ